MLSSDDLKEIAYKYCSNSPPYKYCPFALLRAVSLDFKNKNSLSSCKEWILDDTAHLLDFRELEETGLIIQTQNPQKDAEIIQFTLNKTEKLVDIEPSKVFSFGNAIGVLGSKDWSLNPPILSFYGTLCRTAVKCNNSWDNLVLQHKSFDKFLNALKERDTYFHNDPKVIFNSFSRDIYLINRLHDAGIYNLLDKKGPYEKQEKIDKILKKSFD